MLRPRKPIRRFDIYVEYHRQKAQREGLPDDEAKGYALWAAKVTAANRMGTPVESVAEVDLKRQAAFQKTRAEKWRDLNGELQTDVLFDEEIIERMGRDFYDRVFAPAIQRALEDGYQYSDIRDSLREEWKP